MDVHYQGSALAASWLVAVYALYLQNLVVRRVRVSDRDTGFAWWLAGSLCVGTGVWAESFLGLVAMQLPIRVGYVVPVVLASWLPAVAISGATIWMHSHQRLAIRSRVLGGLLVVAGLCLLTFVNVSALVLTPGVDWRMPYVLIAPLALLLACTAGSVLMRHDLQQEANRTRGVGVATLVGSLLRGGQFLLVAAIGVPAGAACLSADQLSGDALEFVLTVTVLLLMVMGHLGTALDARAQRKTQDLAQSLAQAQSALQAAAHQDSQTGLLNRLGFEQQLQHALSGDSRMVSHLCVLRLNLDGYRAFVETYGHSLGDTLMRHLAHRLQAHVRDGDVLARADSDEFLLMCCGMADEHLLAQLAQRLGEVLREPCLISGQDISVSASIGIARYPASANADQLLAHASDAMLIARKAGGGVYCFHAHGMDRLGADQVDMQRDLRHAIERGELALYFQPKLRASTGALSGVEALLRWQHPTRGMVSPGEFIPVAERFGLIGSLGLWVLNEACRYIRQWHDAGLDIPVAVNVSAHQLRQPDLEAQVRAALQRHQVPPRLLIVEITESVAMDDIDASLRVFDMLDDIGVRLSIDDFGTGYSSLSYLRRLPARQLKIDRSFVHDLETSRDAQAIVEAVVRLAHALGLKVVAEGVETPGQAEILTQLQCDELQGYLFARPMPEHALLVWLVQHGTVVPAVTSARLPQHHDPDGLPDGLPDDDDDVATAWSELESARP
jgi:diguanylate cyclase (GGDEF)-like protein